ncbi:PREDICTED: uncharacterized protein LOC106121834 [Papilio xuthus]|uniref:Uncharacterized protein LOC106121834 n=1 Tax=Papilio xuthus TaxID=66420 RepID=A0AAJ6ZIC9_PAPXU|nr:PREDICTED: uncharacterized protein LOC106121834 [Papilio xuthus]
MSRPSAKILLKRSGSLCEMLIQIIDWVGQMKKLMGMGIFNFHIFTYEYTQPNDVDQFQFTALRFNYCIKATCDKVHSSEKEADSTMSSSAGREKTAAPPGLLHRRYSAPETVMRKYRLEQLNAQESNSILETCPCALSDAEAGSARRERGATRRSALLRRLRGRVVCACVCRCAPACRSLDASRSELRPTSAASASGRTSPNRLRLESSTTPSRLGVSSSTERDAAISSFTDTDVRNGSASETTYKDVSEAGLRLSEMTGVATPTISTAGSGSRPDGNSFADSSDTFSVTTCTTRDAARRAPSSAAAGADEVQQHDNVTTRPPSYDILEIVVSESVDTNYTSGSNVSFSDNKQKRLGKQSPDKYKDISGENIDEYVSGILVESLNSLTDQLESMNASIGANGKLNIIEKEIKIKLQNTGVNTIVHLSPTSNNQIIFGHEELCSSDERRERSGEPGAPLPALLSQPAGAGRPALPHHSVDNRAVLQQIQRLFQDDFQLLERNARYSNESMSSISHIEISKADVYLENEPASYSTTAEVIEKPASSETSEVISGVGAGNYYENIADNTLVARFSAFPHSESMEVNTSSSEDADLHGSECASLVDSLDDPNSPRSVAFRKSARRRSELVRSSIDVLDLLPENAYRTESAASKDKGEAFFVTIKDDHCECDRENKDIVVADHMPEIIKQRLYRRHRNRELRLERARRSKAQQMRRELAHQGRGLPRSARNEVEREGISLIKSLIDDAILKIVQDELKCMRIKQKSVLMVSAKSDESLCPKNRKNISHCKKLSKNNASQSCSDGIDKKYRKEKFQIRGKLSLQAYPSSQLDDSKSKRIYQKSEIHDGKRCIEILEILEYVSSSASSPETSNSDENLSSKVKKSRIPVPVSDRVASQLIQTSKCSTASSNATSASFPYNVESMSAHSSSAARDVSEQADARADGATAPARRRSAALHCEPRSRSNSLRFKRVFDMIPEEKPIAIVETGSEHHMYCRRASLPTLTDDPLHDAEESLRKKKEGSLNINRMCTGVAAVKSIVDSTIGKETRSAGTSPMPDRVVHRSVLTQTHAVGSSTSPNRSAATSPIRNMSMSTQTLSPRRKSSPNQYPKIKIQQVSQSLQRRREQSRRPCAPQHPRARQPPPPPPPPGGGNGRREKTVRQEEGLRLPLCGAGSGGAGGTADCSSSSSSESGGLLCALAPGWLHARRRRRRLAGDAGQWAVTVAGSCRAALPTDVEMRLRFPDTAHAPRACPPPAAQPAQPLCRAVRHPVIQINYQIM